MDRPFVPGSSGLMFYGNDQRPPVRELYGAFRRPPNDADRSVGELAVRTGALDRVDDQVVESEGRLRTHEDDQERLVLHRRDGTTNVIELRPES